MTAGPIFLGGLSSSGKTPLRQVLGAHPEFVLTRRTRLWTRFYGRFGDLTIPANLDACLAAVLTAPGVEQLRPDPDRIRRELRDGPVTYGRLFGLLHQHHADRLGKRRWGEQLGGIERFADPIMATFPDARLIHMLHRPRVTSWPGPGRRPVHGGVDLIRWVRSVRLARHNQARYPDRYRLVPYERFVAQPLETLSELCDFLQERLDPQMVQMLRRLSITPDNRRGRKEGRPWTP